MSTDFSSISQICTWALFPARYQWVLNSRWEIRDSRDLDVTQGWGLPWWLSGKESACQCGRHRFTAWSGKMPRPLSPPALEHVLSDRGSHCIAELVSLNQRVAPALCS